MTYPPTTPPGPQHAGPALLLPPTPPPRKHTTRNVLLVIVAGLVALCIAGSIGAAISGGKKPATAGATPAATTPAASTAAKVTTYNTPAQIIDALNHAGLGCGSEVPVAHPGNGAFTMSQCGGSVVISTYANPGGAAASRDALSAVMKDLGNAGFAVTFGNFLINAGHDQTYAQKVADLFHGTLTPIGAKPSPAAPAVPTITDGTWTVGEDFPAGSYRTTGSGPDCYWSIYKSGTNQSDIIDNHIGAGNLRVTLKAGQDFETERCGTWTKVG